MKLRPSVEALYWETRKEGTVQCLLCPVHCVLKEGKRGVCMAKVNRDGRLMAVAYGLAAALNLDPIEKKPLYHFLPGTAILSTGPNACNLGCQFCQNFRISQEEAPVRYISPEELAAAAATGESIGVAYTYTEPLMWYEYVLDAAREVKKAGLKNVLVTNGYLEPKPFDRLLPLVDALNIDIKSMDEDFYRKVCRGKLAPILRNVEKAATSAHVEITNLVIPGLNDTDGHFERLAKFMAGVNPFMPLHFSRYFPMYKMDDPATPVETLRRAARIALQHLKYVFVGNVAVPENSDTNCSFCGSLLIERVGYQVAVRGLENGLCGSCGRDAKIVLS